MKYRNLRRTVLIIIAAMAAAELSRGALNPFVLDLFGSCFDGTSDPESLTCEYARPIMTHLIGGIVFFFTVFLLGFIEVKLVKPIAAVAMALGYVVLQMAAFRLTLSLSDNFAGLRDPTTFTEYLFATYVSLTPLLIGAILAWLYQLSVNVNRYAVDPEHRSEPKQAYGKNALKETPTKKVKKTTKKKVVKKKIIAKK